MSRWSDTNLIPLSGLEAWYEIVAGVTADDVIYDTSGNNRHVTTASGDPELQANVWNAQPAIYWDGSANPLVWTGSVTAKHIFIVAAFDGAAFTGFEGLLSDETTFGLLVAAGAASVKFLDLDPSLEPYTYEKNSTLFDSGDHAAPMGLANLALIELKFDAPFVLDGVQFGQDRAFTARKWKGWLFESLIYSGDLTPEDLSKIYLYFNLKFGLHANGLPFRFPDPTLTGIGYSHFDDEPRDYAKTTESHVYEDEGQTFNEKGISPPQYWELEFDGRTAQEVFIFDEFWKQARIANPFFFLDKYGILWENVRVARYDRTHEAHRSWIKKAAFRLVQYQPTDFLPIVYDSEAIEYIFDGGGS